MTAIKDLQLKSNKIAPKSRILVVDGEPIVRGFICFLLHNDGHEVLDAETGEQAIEILETNDQVDLVLLDLALPDVDGMDVLQYIRSKTNLSESAAIIVTANEDSERAVKAFEHGANDYITKPIDADIASIRINNQLNLIRAQKALLQSRERYDLAASGSYDGLWDWDLQTGEIYVSERWQEMLGIESASAIISPEIWLERIHPSDRGSFDFGLEQNLSGATDNFEHEHRIRHADGSWRWVLCRAMAIREKSDRAHRIAGWLTDITQGKMVDALTGLSNRGSFLERLKSCLERLVQKRSSGFAVLFIDLDNFKLINDSHGHDVGDEYLKMISSRIQNKLRSEGSMAARMGGDEFTITVEDIADCKPAQLVAKRIFDAVSQPIRIENQTLFPSISVGISYTNDGSSTAEDLLREADTAMYQAKAQGKSGIQVFDPAMQLQVKNRLRIESELRQAIELKQFVLHYQPIIDMRSGTMVAFEALVRWNHPERGLIGPVEFIQIAEETSLVIQMGEFVLQEACRQMAAWIKLNPQFKNTTCNVNVSRKQLKCFEFANQLQQALNRNQLSPENIQLEITESSLFDNRGNSQKLLAEIQESGVRIALDDFGIGQSSLACLHELPLDTLKIDRSFVAPMLKNKRSEAIVKAIVTLSEGLGLSLVAEGVEEESQRDFLISLGCEIAQGYLFAKPMPAEELPSFFAASMETSSRNTVSYSI